MRPKKSSRRKSKISSFPGFLTILGIFFVMLSGSLIAVHFQSQKKYDPSLENKLEMKTIPPEVRNGIGPVPTAEIFRVPILMYHYVEYVKDKGDTIRISLNTTPYTLEQQIIALKDAGYSFMTASQLGKVLDGQAQMPKKPILLTFDDGHRDFYTDAFPILKKYNVPSTAYIISGFIGGSDFMDSYQIQEIANSGLVEIGDHTIHHIYMKKQTEKTLAKEVNDSKIELQKDYNVPVVSFAYPYGAFDKLAISVVRNAGFTTAMSTLPGIIVSNSNRYFIERIRPGGRIGDNLTNFLDSYQQSAQTSVSTQD